MGMTKIIYGADFDATCGVGMEIVDRQGELHKQASTIFDMDYDAMKPDDKHVGIHVVALGDSEHYQFNRNGDGFPKKACVDYHNTFVKHGHVFRHHRNKDPEKAIGIIKASAYNEPMGRIELFIHADKEKAAPELERLEKEGEHPFSMACVVDHDRCFTKGTLVLTDRGFVPIESVSVGDICITAEAEPSRVVATTVNMSSALTRVSVRGIPDEIECTPNHPFNVVSADKMRSCSGSANGLRRRHTPKDGTTRCRTCGKAIDVSSEWKQACQLVCGDYVKEKIDKCSESVVRGVSFAYLCGMYVGDGSPIWEVSGHEGKGDTARITGLQISASASDKDAEILERIKEAFRLCTGKDASVNSESGGKNAYIVALSDGLLANKIVNLTGSYCREKFLSSEILTWSRAEKAAFVAGYLDADGAAGLHDKRPIFRVCSVNKGLLLSVQRLLWSLGVPATVGLGNALESMKDSSGFCHKSSVYHVFFAKAPSILVSASVKLSEFCKRNTFANGGSGILLIDGYAYLPVSSVRTFESECVSTYNFEVEGSHTYVAEGVGVHNCSICGAMRKHAGDSSECDHVANHLGELFEDGKQVGTYNDEPKFFDISFVGRPADRIAWSLKVASASALPLGSVKEAELEGVYPPDELVCEKGASARKLGYARDIAGLQQIYRGWMSKSASVRTPTEMYLYELRRVRTGGLPDDVISRLREVNEKVAMHALASNGVVMDIPTFFKYATGDDYVPVVEKYIVPLMSYYPSYLENMVKKSTASRFCANGMFDVSEQHARDLPFEIERSVKEAAFADDIRRIAVESSGSLEEPHLVDTKVPDWFNGPVVEKLAETYASYQMSAVDAVLGTGSRNKLDVEAVLAANNVSQR